MTNDPLLPPSPPYKQESTKDAGNDPSNSLLEPAVLNALSALAMIDAAILTADAAHVYGMSTAGVGVRYDPKLIISDGTPAKALRSLLIKRGILEADADLQAQVDLQRGNGLPDGTKSLAFTLCFQAEDRTLTDAEVNKAFEEIQKKIVASGTYSIRT